MQTEQRQAGASSRAQKTGDPAGGRRCQSNCACVGLAEGVQR
jgi:hypothetical protein